MRTTVSVGDRLIRDLLVARGRALGLHCEPTDAGLIVDGAASVDDSASHHVNVVPNAQAVAAVAVVATIDAEALELCGRDGVTAVLTHQSPPVLLDLALTSVADGVILDPQIAVRLARRMARAEPLGANRGLTDREQEILQLMSGGLALKQIADRLEITTKTVENHATKLYAKLGVRNRREAAALALGASVDAALEADG